jgi:hypothetical protein
VSFVGGGWRSGSAADVATGANSTATVTNVSPNTFIRGTPVPITVTGTGFTAQTVIYANYSPVATIFDSTTQLRCTSFSTTLDSGGAGTIVVGVVKPGEKMSGTQNFNVT